jgi:hypothetical protein
MAPSPHVIRSGVLLHFPPSSAGVLMPEPSTPAAPLVRFGVFELNLRSGDLMLIENFR